MEIKKFCEPYLDAAMKLAYENYLEEYSDMVANVTSGEYYIKMAVAWYFATALAKQYTHMLPVLEKRLLPAWVHNKTIQKATESFRIPPERKNYLRTLRIK